MLRHSSLCFIYSREHSTTFKINLTMVAYATIFQYVIFAAMEKTSVFIDFEKSLGPWVGRTSKLVDYHIQEGLDRHGLDLTKEQMVVLKKLSDQDGLNQNELASQTYRDKSSLARLLAKMEKKGYLYRRQNEVDKRINEVFLSPIGREIFEDCKVVIKDIMQTMEQHLSASEIQDTIRVLKQVHKNFEAKRPVNN